MDFIKIQKSVFFEGQYLKKIRHPINQERIFANFTFTKGLIFRIDNKCSEYKNNNTI